MKISEELSDSYLHCLASSNGNVKTVCDALQQAVAENLELQHRLEKQKLPHDCDGCLCPLTEDDWLAKADRLLRGGHD